MKMTPLICVDLRRDVIDVSEAANVVLFVFEVTFINDFPSCWHTLQVELGSVPEQRISEAEDALISAIIKVAEVSCVRHCECMYPTLLSRE